MSGKESVLYSVLCSCGCGHLASKTCTRCIKFQRAQPARYVSQNCQKADWHRHRKECQPLPVQTVRGVDPSPFFEPVFVIYVAGPSDSKDFLQECSDKAKEALAIAERTISNIQVMKGPHVWVDGVLQTNADAIARAGVQKLVPTFLFQTDDLHSDFCAKTNTNGMLLRCFSRSQIIYPQDKRYVIIVEDSDDIVFPTGTFLGRAAVSLVLLHEPKGTLLSNRTILEQIAPTTPVFSLRRRQGVLVANPTFAGETRTPAQACSEAPTGTKPAPVPPSPLELTAYTYRHAELIPAHCSMSLLPSVETLLNRPQTNVRFLEACWKPSGGPCNTAAATHNLLSIVCEVQALIPAAMARYRKMIRALQANPNLTVFQTLDVLADYESSPDVNSIWPPEAAVLAAASLVRETEGECSNTVPRLGPALYHVLECLSSLSFPSGRLQLLERAEAQGLGKGIGQHRLLVVYMLTKMSGKTYNDIIAALPEGRNVGYTTRAAGTAIVGMHFGDCFISDPKGVKYNVQTLVLRPTASGVVRLAQQAFRKTQQEVGDTVLILQTGSVEDGDGGQAFLLQPAAVTPTTTGFGVADLTYNDGLWSIQVYPQPPKTKDFPQVLTVKNEGHPGLCNSQKLFFKCLQSCGCVQRLRVLPLLRVALPTELTMQVPATQVTELTCRPTDEHARHLASLPGSSFRFAFLRMSGLDPYSISQCVVGDLQVQQKVWTDVGHGVTESNVWVKVAALPPAERLLLQPNTGPAGEAAHLEHIQSPEAFWTWVERALTPEQLRLFLGLLLVSMRGVPTSSQVDTLQDRLQAAADVVGPAEDAVLNLVVEEVLRDERENATKAIHERAGRAFERLPGVDFLRGRFPAAMSQAVECARLAESFLDHGQARSSGLLPTDRFPVGQPVEMLRFQLQLPTSLALAAEAAKSDANAEHCPYEKALLAVQPTACLQGPYMMVRFSIPLGPEFMLPEDALRDYSHLDPDGLLLRHILLHLETAMLRAHRSEQTHSQRRFTLADAIKRACQNSRHLTQQVRVVSFFLIVLLGVIPTNGGAPSEPGMGHLVHGEPRPFSGPESARWYKLLEELGPTFRDFYSSQVQALVESVVKRARDALAANQRASRRASQPRTNGVGSRVGTGGGSKVVSFDEGLRVSKHFTLMIMKYRHKLRDWDSTLEPLVAKLCFDPLEVLNEETVDAKGRSKAMLQRMENVQVWRSVQMNDMETFTLCEKSGAECVYVRETTYYKKAWKNRGKLFKGPAVYIVAPNANVAGVHCAPPGGICPCDRRGPEEETKDVPSPAVPAAVPLPTEEEVRQQVRQQAKDKVLAMGLDVERMLEAWAPSQAQAAPITVQCQVCLVFQSGEPFPCASCLGACAGCASRGLLTAFSHPPKPAAGHVDLLKLSSCAFCTLRLPMDFCEAALAKIGIPEGTLRQALNGAPNSGKFVTCAGVNGGPCTGQRPFPIPLAARGACAAAGEAAAEPPLAWCEECSAEIQKQAKAEASTAEALIQRRAMLDALLESGVIFRLCPCCGSPGESPSACYHITCPNPKCNTEWCWICRQNFTGRDAAYKAMLHVSGHVEELNEELKSEWEHGMFDEEEDGYTIYNFPLREDPSAEAEWLGVPIFINLPLGVFTGFAGKRELMHWESSEQSDFF